MKIGILGSGIVARTLALGFVKHGYPVMLGTRDPAKLADLVAEHPALMLGSFSETAAFAELAVLAVKGSVAAQVLELAGIDNLYGKTLIDANNPIADAPPVNGVLQFFTPQNTSLMEQLQQQAPGIHLVKAFNSVGSAMMVNPAYAEGKPTMFICGNEARAKQQVSRILEQFGWLVEDMGAIEAARAIEPLCMLWCIKGLAQGQWTHAFKLLTH